ncbi:hypothetical protein HMPREF9062_1011 [Actinomyces sp. oral taxon 448 str. F0400]|nr:hypothetical protein HMPREF9062_1011 [Actinomyces sp. oral taxon 448 str. F0400]
MAHLIGRLELKTFARSHRFLLRVVTGHWPRAGRAGTGRWGGPLGGPGVIGGRSIDAFGAGSADPAHPLRP